MELSNAGPAPNGGAEVASKVRECEGEDEMKTESSRDEVLALMCSDALRDGINAMASGSRASRLALRRLVRSFGKTPDDYTMDLVKKQRDSNVNLPIYLSSAVPTSHCFDIPSSSPWIETPPPAWCTRVARAVDDIVKTATRAGDNDVFSTSSHATLYSILDNEGGGAVNVVVDTANVEVDVVSCSPSTIFDTLQQRVPPLLPARRTVDVRIVALDDLTIRQGSNMMTTYRFLLSSLLQPSSSSASRETPAPRLRVGRDAKGRACPRRGRGVLAYDPSYPHCNLKPPHRGLIALEVRTWHANLRDEECDALVEILRHLHVSPTSSSCLVAFDALSFCCIETLLRCWHNMWSQYCCSCSSSSRPDSQQSLPLAADLRRRLHSAPLSRDGRLDRMRAAFGANRKEYTQRILEDLMRSGSNLPVVDDKTRPYVDGTYYPGLDDTFFGRPFVRKSGRAKQKEVEEDEVLEWTRTLRGTGVLTPVRREAEVYLARLIEEEKKRVAVVVQTKEREAMMATVAEKAEETRTRTEETASTKTEEKKTDNEEDADADVVNAKRRQQQKQPIDTLGPTDDDYDETFGPLATKSLSGGPGSWKVCTLTDAGGRPHPDALRLFPEALRLLDRIPRRCGSACVSVLRPGARILLHRGPSNCRLTCHFGVIIPRGDLRIRVGTGSSMWEEGEWLVFDDAYAHSVENRTAGWRLVIIVDVWRDGLSDVECAVLQGRYNAFLE
eukprot:g1624.t1